MSIEIDLPIASGIERLQMSDEAREFEILMLERIWDMPPGGGGGGFTPIDELSKYGGNEPEYRTRTSHTPIDVARFVLGGFVKFKNFLTPEKAPDHTSNHVGGPEVNKFKAGEISDASGWIGFTRDGIPKCR